MIRTLKHMPLNPVSTIQSQWSYCSSQLTKKRVQIRDFNANLFAVGTFRCVDLGSMVCALQRLLREYVCTICIQSGVDCDGASSIDSEIWLALIFASVWCWMFTQSSHALAEKSRAENDPPLSDLTHHAHAEKRVFSECIHILVLTHTNTHTHLHI